MNNQSREARVGDRVRVKGGPYDGRRGRINDVKEQSAVLFAQGPQPLTGLLTEDMALVTFEDKRDDGTDEIGVPIRRLEVL